MRANHLRRVLILAVMLASLLGPNPNARTVGAQSAGTTTRISVSGSGVQGDGGSINPSISANGRFVTFDSFATNLVSGDTNGTGDVFVHDRQTGLTERISVSSAGAQGNGYSSFPSISADGRYVAFSSDANNLVSGDTNGTGGVFVHDRQTGLTERVSVSSSGAQGNGYSSFPLISADGRYVTFVSGASNLVDDDTNGTGDIFVHDRQTGLTERVSVSSAGAQGNNDPFYPSISADGRYVAFNSYATNLVSGDTNGDGDIFVHDRQTGLTERVSVSSAGAQGNNGSSFPSISADGRYVAFDSNATNLISGDTNGRGDVFVHDRQTGLTERVSVSSAGAQGNNGSFFPSISADVRYVAFDSYATNLVSGDTNGTRDVFVHDRQTGLTERVSVSSAGVQGYNYPDEGLFTNSISADGRYVAFDFRATNLVSGDTNETEDIFVRDRGSAFAPHNPIILIPGIMGSRLFYGNQQVWPDLCRIIGLNGGLDPLALGDDGIKALYTQYAGVTIRAGRAGILDHFSAECGIYKKEEDHFYDHLIDHLITLGYTAEKDLFFFPYDWRKDIKTETQKLDALVERAKRVGKTSQVNLLAHSMGGLVARQYILNNDQAKKISKLVTLGTPYLGTPKAYATMMGQACTIDIGQVQIGNIGLSACLPAPSVIQGLAPNFTGFNELMPSQAYFTANGGGFVALKQGQFQGLACIGADCLSYPQTYTHSMVSNINSGIFNKSAEFHAGIDPLSDWNGVDTTVIVGENQPTIFGFEPLIDIGWGSLQIQMQPIPLLNQNGDSTVTLTSSTLGSGCISGAGLLGSAKCYSTERDHGNVVNAYDLIDCGLGLGACLEVSAAADDTDTLVQIIATATAAIDATDVLDNHTGPVSELNSYEEGIPGSSYFDLDRAVSLALPGGQSYALEIIPAGDEPVDLTILRTGTDGSVTRVLYIGIPVTAASRIHFDGDPYALDSWYLDPTSSGERIPILPTLSYDPGEELDTTPPASTISLEGVLGPQGWYTGPVTVTLEATDDGVGVNRIEYAFFNDHQPRVYTGPFIVDPDRFSRILVVAIDRAGNVQTEPSIARIGPDKVFMPVIRLD